MNDEEAEPDPRWWRRIRRSYGLADLIGDDLARTVIIEEMAEADPVRLRAVAGVVLDAVIEIGPSGQLDEWFLDEEQRTRLRTATPPPTRACTVVAERATTVLRPDNWPRRYFDTADVLAASNDIAAALLDRIAMHVKEWPFECPRWRPRTDVP
jgi:hypothetical protein